MPTLSHPSRLLQTKNDRQRRNLDHYLTEQQAQQDIIPYQKNVLRERQDYCVHFAVTLRVVDQLEQKRPTSLELPVICRFSPKLQNAQD
jgi:hypothetical protein